MQHKDLKKMAQEWGHTMDTITMTEHKASQVD